MSETPGVKSPEQQPLQMDPLALMGDYDPIQERKDIAMYHRGITIQRLTVQLQQAQAQIAELTRERDGLKELIEQAKPTPIEAKRAS